MVLERLVNLLQDLLFNLKFRCLDHADYFLELFVVLLLILVHLRLYQVCCISKFDCTTVFVKRR